MRSPTTIDDQDVFDVPAFTRTARGSLRERFDLDAIAVDVDVDAARLLATLSVLEGATMAHLRNVLVTATHKDARVTAFLVTWAFEKYWIADALAAVSRSVASTPGSSPLAGRPARTGLPGGPVRRSIGGFLAGTSIVPVHTVAGLVDDLVLDAAYDVVALKATASLHELLAAIRDTKARHTAFFAAESRRLLSEDGRARRLAGLSIRRGPWPIGALLLDTDDGDAFTATVFGGAKGVRRAEAVAERIARLPGIAATTASALASALAKGA
ncbi:hypothetical protein ACX9R5_14875 [Rathayibacter sp. CAU 1779]